MNKQHVALTRCYFCGKPSAILLARHYTPDGEPAHDLASLDGKVVSMRPCSRCKGYMTQGIILIGIDPEKSAPGWNRAEMPNPYRTGHFVVVRDEVLARIINVPALVEWAIKHRWMFCDGKVCARLAEMQATN